MSDPSVIATVSYCCQIARIGWHPPEVVHSGLCREAHGGVLGQTIYCVDQVSIREARRKALEEAAKVCDDMTYRKPWECANAIRALIGKL